MFSVSLLSFVLATLARNFPPSIALGRCGVKEMSSALLALGTCSALFLLRGHLPLFLSMVVANALALSTVALMILAHAKLFQVATPIAAITGAFVTGFGSVLAHYFSVLDYKFATFAMNIALAWLLAALLVLQVRNAHKTASPMRWTTTWVTGFVSAVFIVRAITIHVVGRPVDPNEQTPLTVFLAIAVSAFATVCSFGFFSMVNARHQKESLAHLSRDSLTGLYSRTAFFEVLRELQLPQSAQSFAVVMLDIDHFKLVNDQFGHQGGDVALSFTGRLIANSIRPHDVACRYGGEEFCIVLQHCTEAEAARLAQRLVTNIGTQAIRLADGRSIAITLSAGYALMQTDERGSNESVESVIMRADNALYHAKANGRNLAISAATPPTAPTPCPTA